MSPAIALINGTQDTPLTQLCLSGKQRWGSSLHATVACICTHFKSPLYKVLVVCTKYVLLVVVDNLQVSAEQFRVGQFKLCRKGCGIYRLEEVCN